MRRFAVLAVIVLASCASGESSMLVERSEPAGWEELPESPLSPRESPVVVALRGDLLVIGGSDADPCPPNADCIVPPEAALRDGARFDLRRRRWTRLPDAPTGVLYAQTAVIGDSVFFMLNENPRPGTRRTLLELSEGGWTEHEPPPGELSLSATDDRLIFYPQSHEIEHTPDYVFDPATDEYRELPADPIAPSFDRAIVWTGNELVLIGRDDVAQPGSEKPALNRAASFDGKSWRSYAVSENIGSPPWFFSGGHVVHPGLGSADGGEVNGWGRSYPNGGMLDPRTREWSDLPNAPDAPRDGSFGQMVAGDRFVVCCGWSFEVSAGRWTRIPPLPGSQPNNAGAAIVDDELVLWGGSRHNEDGTAPATLSDRGWSLRLG